MGLATEGKDVRIVCVRLIADSDGFPHTTCTIALEEECISEPLPLDSLQSRCTLLAIGCRPKNCMHGNYVLEHDRHYPVLHEPQALPTCPAVASRGYEEQNVETRGEGGAHSWELIRLFPTS